MSAHLFTKKRLKHWLVLTIYWILAYTFYTNLRFIGGEPLRGITWEILYTLSFLAGLVMGTVTTLFGILFERRVFRLMSYGRLILVKTASYIAVFLLLWIGLVDLGAYLVTGEININYFDNDAFQQRTISFQLFSFVAIIIINVWEQVDLKFGPGNFYKLILGKFHHPREDFRIFMFLDLKSSTTIAEKIGHVQYSRLLQDCFNDLTIVMDYEAEVYQYVGDEAVLTWSLPNGLSDLNFLHAYYAFHDLLGQRGDYYLQQYGVKPFFKAGVNVGDVVVAEVGQIKREIAFHGDTMNTAARIHDKCNEFGKSILISGSLMELIGKTDDFKFEEMGYVALKGKDVNIGIYSAERTMASEMAS